MKRAPSGQPRLCSFEGCTTYVSRGERCHKHGNGRPLTQRRAAAQERREIAAELRDLAIPDQPDDQDKP